MVAWLRARRRRRILAEPFPPAWDEIIDRNVPAARYLRGPTRARLRELVQIFVAEKSFEGCGGFEIDDEARITIAAHACLLVLGRPRDDDDQALFRDVESILVYPGGVIAPPRPRGIFEITRSPIAVTTVLDGEAHLHGPVVLSWDAVLDASDELATRNVVLHELAHKIDMADGVADGTPPLPTDAEIRAWAAICSRELIALREAVELGIPTVIDPYGATNEAEFFAVVTETFFLRPWDLRAGHPELYALFAKFYRLG
jgi:Mlc titration factor MtfA (ptsG expression regulator)